MTMHDQSSAAATVAPTNRRRFERFRLIPGYCGAIVRRASGEELTGHAYDISESGVRIELDEALQPGERVGIEIEIGSEFIAANAHVIWRYDDADDPGPVRMALDYTEGLSASNRRRLVQRFCGAGMLRAA